MVRRQDIVKLQEVTTRGAKSATDAAKGQKGVVQQISKQEERNSGQEKEAIITHKSNTDPCKAKVTMVSCWTAGNRKLLRNRWSYHRGSFRKRVSYLKWRRAENYNKRRKIRHGKSIKMKNKEHAWTKDIEGEWRVGGFNWRWSDFGLSIALLGKWWKTSRVKDIVQYVRLFRNVGGICEWVKGYLFKD